jgi:meiotically up-regulated gene 157 (Mug157) protein
MQYVISENMVTVMEEYYFKKLNKKWIDIEKFISELQKTKDRMNLAIRKEDKQKKYELYLMSKDIPSNKNTEESEEAEPKPD